MSSRPSKSMHCRHDPTTFCTPCRRERERNDLQHVGTWARGSSNGRNESTDYESFLRNNPDALSSGRGTSSATSRHHAPSKKPSNPPSQKSSDKHHQKGSSHTAKPASSAAATRSSSPAAQRSPHHVKPAAYSSRQTLPASKNAAAVARDNLRAMTPQTARLVGLHISRAQESDSDSDSDSD